MKLAAALLLLALCTSSEPVHQNYSSPKQELFRAQDTRPRSRPETVFIKESESDDNCSRLPITGFGQQPPPLGSDKDPATKTCGLPPPFCVKSRYRSIDGSCNNLRRPSWGMAQTPYGRLLPFNYADGIHAMPAASSGEPLPNARELSFQLFPDIKILDPKWNLNTQQWGQVIAHDMSLTGNIPQTGKNPITCCTDDGQLTADSFTNPSCAPILIPPNDPIHDPQITECLNFVRSATTKDRNCTAPNVPAKPLTTVTAFMDLSLVYGSSAIQANPIRAWRGGRLLTNRKGGREWPPQDPNVTAVCEPVESSKEPCFLAGDIRVNQNPQLTVLQVILLREHNRIADILAQYNPHWNDETIYQEARRIHIAQMQHITYYEYLPILLGFENMVSQKLIYPNAEGYVNDYDPEIDPSILNEHATAAYRHFHTLIRGFLQLVTETRRAVDAVRLSDWFNRPLILVLDNVFDKLLRGLTAQKQSASDQFFDSEITQFLFRRNRTFGGDLRASDIQRGRDHGLGSYIATREVCGLPVPNTFEDMTDFISEDNVRILESLYESPQDVDLVVAGALERIVQGTLAGPTHLCILIKQFYKTRVGDRYFYENGADPYIAFTPSQLQAIRKGASVARLLCDNGDNIQFMQPKAFQQLSAENMPVPCEKLPYVDLTPWRDLGRYY